MRVLVVLSLGLGLAVGAPRTQSKPPTVGSVLLMAGGTELDDALLTAALADTDPLVRAAAARVIGAFAAGPLLPQIASALEKEQDPHAGAELIRTLLFLDPGGGATRVERHAQRFGGRAATVLTAWRDRALAAPAGPAVANDPLLSRLFPAWQPGLLRELAAAAGCPLSNDPSFGYTRITYRADGRALSVAIDPGRLPKPCTAVLAAIGRTTFADESDAVRQGQQQWIVVPLSRAYAECVDVADVREPVRMGATIKPPRKVKDVRPNYPLDLLKQRVEGMVVLNATIATRGCVRDARVTKSPALGLELEALRAVSGWAFEPVLVDGAPAPAGMMLTVNFRIQR